MDNETFLLIFNFKVLCLGITLPGKKYYVTTIYSPIHSNTDQILESVTDRHSTAIAVVVPYNMNSDDKVLFNLSTLTEILSKNNKISQFGHSTPSIKFGQVLPDFSVYHHNDGIKSLQILRL